MVLAHVLSGIQYALGMPGPAAAKPRIDALRATVKARRVTVTVHYSGCAACEAELRIGRVKTLLRAHGGVARGTSPRLALGRARAIVVLTGVGIRLSASRPVVIR